MYAEILIGGFGGGAVRGLMGFIKHQYSYKNVQFELPYFIGMTNFRDDRSLSGRCRK